MPRRPSIRERAWSVTVGRSRRPTGRPSGTRPARRGEAPAPVPAGSVPRLRVERGRPSRVDVAALVVAPAHLRCRADERAGGPAEPSSGSSRAAWRRLERRHHRGPTGWCDGHGWDGRRWAGHRGRRGGPRVIHRCR
ncbi:acyl-CoA carboxylase subunit epsilon [Streptomyces sp. NPDC057433]|uniref:acyl-CoA carboxylase subunit epsilon n=1 Tax=Streptomyces sp. NPDC057433 TaxID=3346132 RepID=UPI00369CFBF8